MSDEIKIEKGVPVPPRRHRYPFHLMEIGDSFFIPNGKQNNLGSYCSYKGRRLSMKFITREVDGGVRVWRVK